MMGLKIRDLFVKVYHPKSRAWASFKLRMHHKAHMSCAPDALATRLRLSSSTSSENNNNNNNNLQLNAVRAYSAHRGQLPLLHSLS